MLLLLYPSFSEHFMCRQLLRMFQHYKRSDQHIMNRLMLPGQQDGGKRKQPQ